MMNPSVFRLCVFCVLWCGLALLPARVTGQRGAQNGDWRFYGADPGGTKYSPLDRINAANVKNLRIAWRWKADNFGPDPEYNLQATPLAMAPAARRCGPSGSMKAIGAGWRRAAIIAAFRTGPMDAATTGLSTSRPATSWSR